MPKFILACKSRDFDSAKNIIDGVIEQATTKAGQNDIMISPSIVAVASDSFFSKANCFIKKVKGNA